MNNERVNTQINSDDFLDDPRLSRLSVALAIVVKTEARLSPETLDIEISMEEKAYIRARDGVVFRMARLGKLYSQKKADLGHGDFIPWIENKSGISRSEVNRCIRVYSEFPEAISNASDLTHLNQDAILALIYAPESVKLEVKERLLEGETFTKKQINELKKQVKAKPVIIGIEEQSPLGKDKNDIAEGVFVDVPLELALANETEPVIDESEYSQTDSDSEFFSDSDLIKDLIERNEYLESLYKIFESDDRLGAATKELENLKEISRVQQSQINGLTNENAAMKRAFNSLERRYKKSLKESNVDNPKQPPIDESRYLGDIPEFVDDYSAEDVAAWLDESDMESFQ
jgi:hypothetical protein